jgi:hypothetical protein
MASLTGKGAAFQSSFLGLIFNATAITLLAQNNSSPTANLYVALHTADPTQAGDQTSNEIAYTNYARVAVARTSAGWTISGSSPTSVKNTAAVTFPACGTTGATATWFTVGVASSGASVALYGGQLTSSLAISNGITPSFAISALTITED